MAMLDGKTALVTGAGRGIGRGIALALAGAGAKVVVNDIGASLAGEGGDRSPADAVVREIKAAGGVAEANYGNVADFVHGTEMVEQVAKAWGRIDILVHVAGIDRDPDNVAPLVVYLASDAAAQVNGQVFHSFGYGYTLLAQPQALRRLEGHRRLKPEEIARLWADTFGGGAKPAIGTAFGRTLNERPATEWKEIEPGIRAWKWAYGEP